MYECSKSDTFFSLPLLPISISGCPSQGYYRPHQLQCEPSLIGKDYRWSQQWQKLNFSQHFQRVCPSKSSRWAQRAKQLWDLHGLNTTQEEGFMWAIHCKDLEYISQWRLETKKGSSIAYLWKLFKYVNIWYVNILYWELNMRKTRTINTVCTILLSNWAIKWWQFYVQSNQWLKTGMHPDFKFLESLITYFDDLTCNWDYDFQWRCIYSHFFCWVWLWPFAQHHLW